MRLTLSVLTLQDQAPFTSMSHTFDQSGGSVGRHQRAGWVLLDDKKFLSGEHFNIHCDGKDFFVVDTSTNGTFVNDTIHPLGQNNSHQLREGDRIKIGEYVLLASIFADSAAPASGFPQDFPASSGESTSNDPFFSSGGHFNDTPKNTGKTNNDSAFESGSKAGSQKSSFVDPNQSGTFGQPSELESPSDPFFSFDDSFSPEETTFPKDKDIIEADTPLNIHTPLPTNSIDSSPQKPASQVPPEVFANISDDDEPDVFNFLDEEKPEPENTPSPNQQNTNAVPDAIEEAIPAEKDIQTQTNNPQDVSTSAADTPSPEALEERQTTDQEKNATTNKKTEPEPSNQKTNTPSQSQNEAIEMLLKGAGITRKHLPSEVPAETFEIIGHALKEVLQGTIELLRARAETKNHLHLDRTIIGRIENNPLKFMPNAEQVIVHLLTSESSDKTYTPLDKALAEAFDDIMAHQFAMTVATQNALRGVIKEHFSPENLAENMAKKHPISSLIPLQRQAKLWSMFESLYDEVEKEAAENFQRLLDTEISNAYEKQLMELKSLRIKNNNDFPE